MRCSEVPIHLHPILVDRSIDVVMDLGRSFQLTFIYNYAGFTVLVPRAHLPSDIFSLNKADYAQLVEAAHTVAGVLKRALGARQIGMIFEGFEIDYAHVKLVPIRDPPATPESLYKQGFIQQADYHEKYPGYVTSLHGPAVRDTESLSKDAEAIRKLLQQKGLKAPVSA